MDYILRSLKDFEGSDCEEVISSSAVAPSTTYVEEVGDIIQSETA